AVSDLAPARRTETSDLTDRVLREIVVQQETAFDFAFLEIVDELLVFLGAESRRNERLRLAAGEKRRAVYAWQPADFGCDRTNLGEPPAIGTPPLVENIVTEDHLFELIEDQFRHRASFGLIFRIRLDNFLLKRIDRRVAGAFFLTGCVERRAQVFRVTLGNLACHVRVELQGRHVALLDLERFVELFLPATEAVNF